jgi:hypothetical protein
VALRIDSHLHHDRVHRWFGSLKRNHFATCVVTQGTLLRVHVKTAADSSAAAAWQALREVSAHPKHEWWGRSLSFLAVPHRQLQGSAQVTDAWLAELARQRKVRLATLDSGLAALHDDVAAREESPNRASPPVVISTAIILGPTMLDFGGAERDSLQSRDDRQV